MMVNPERHNGGVNMNIPGPDSRIARFLTKICDLIFLNAIFILTDRKSVV